MPLNIAQLLIPPGGPGVIGAVQAGTGLTIEPDGTVNLTGDLSGFAPGTTSPFGQPAAPTGWTKVTTYDNYAIRVVSGAGGGTGGSQPFTSAFTTYRPTGSVSVTNLVISGISIGASSLAGSQNGNHTHSYQAPSPSGSNCTGPGQAGIPIGANAASGYSGGGRQHTHTASGNASASGSGSFNGTSTTQFAVSYYDVILCRKD